MAKPSKPEPDVNVHLTEESGGCPICGSTGQHTHTQQDWRDVVDKADPWGKGK